MKTDSYEVKRIDRKNAEAVVVSKHYTRRLGIFWEAFGLYYAGVLSGVVVYGQPSAPINRHAFKDRDFRLYELTRLVVERGLHNGASVLISRSLALLSVQPCAVISYADSSAGHCGIVYQATNWAYTGATTAHECMYVVDGEKLHAMTVMARFNVTNPGEWAKANGIERVKPGQKHRYFQFVGSRSQKRAMMRKLSYPIVAEYPKADKALYDDGPSIWELSGATA